MLKILLAAGALALCASGAFSSAVWAQAAANGHAAPPEPFTYKSDGDLGVLAAKPGVSPVLAMLSDHENYFVEVVGRTKTGEPEFHAHWIDYVIVQHGEGALTYGGIDTSSRDTGAGELRGGTISGGTTIDIHPGDYFQVPAGLWHQIALKPGTTSFRYYVVKIRQ
jgi:mannose-6-phosphate isomerase-like protein (cupin superfamily)